MSKKYRHSYLQIIVNLSFVYSSLLIFSSFIPLNKNVIAPPSNIIYNWNELPMWSEISETVFAEKDGKKKIYKNYRTYKLDTTVLNKVLANANENPDDFRNSRSFITLPIPDGTYALFRFAQSPTSVYNESDKVKFNIKTYTGQGVSDMYLGASFDLTTSGFHAMIFKDDKTIFIEPYSLHESIYYICYYKDDILIKNPKQFEVKGPVKH